MGALVTLAGVCLLLEPVVEPVVIGGRPVPLFVLSFVVFTVALDLGGAIFALRGQWTAALAHGIPGLILTLPLFGYLLGVGS